LLLLKAQNTHLVAHVTAAVAFLEAAESGGFESRREQPLSTEYRICGTRLSGAQDDLLRFATYTFLAEEFKDDVNDVKQLAQRINVTAQVLRRALGKYKKLEGQLTHRGSLEVVKTLAQCIRSSASPSMEEQNELLTRVAVLSPKPIADGSRCVGAELASFFAMVLPSTAAIELPGSGLHQLGTGVQLHLKPKNVTWTRDIWANSAAKNISSPFALRRLPRPPLPPPLVLYLKGLTQLDRAAHFPRVAAQGVVKRRRKVLVGATHPLPLQCALCLQGLVPLRSGAARLIHALFKSGRQDYMFKKLADGRQVPSAMHSDLVDCWTLSTCSYPRTRCPTI
jgi:hypothetical protein